VWSSDVYSRTQDEKTATGSPQLNASFTVDAGQEDRYGIFRSTTRRTTFNKIDQITFTAQK